MAQFWFILVVLLSFFTLPDGLVEGKKGNPKDGKKDISDWTFQEGFCSHADPLDKRLNIHSFMVTHGQLYIIVALAYFIVPLGNPPFKVTHGRVFSELSNELPNNLVRTYRTTAYCYASFALEIDDSWELLVLSFSLMDLPRKDSRYHTQSILRNTESRYSEQQPPPGTYPIMFNGNFHDEAHVNGSSRTRYHVDRFICADGYMFQVQRQIADDNQTTVNYIFRYDVRPHLNISFEEYILHPVSENDPAKEWFLDSLTYYRSTGNTEYEHREFAVRLMKNGYMTADRMYLTTFKYLEEYELSYPFGRENQSRLQLKYLKSMVTNDVLSCEEDPQFQLTLTTGVGLFFLLVILLLALNVITSKTALYGGHRFMVGPKAVLFELTDEEFYKLKKQ